jgi:DNA-directed RNA polymerase specialized sigma24 family protein
MTRCSRPIYVSTASTTHPPTFDGVSPTRVTANTGVVPYFSGSPPGSWREQRRPNRPTTSSTVHRLPYRQRVAVVLRYYEDLSTDDIATTLRCSTKAAESLVQNGVQSLRRHLGPETGPAR